VITFGWNGRSQSPECAVLIQYPEHPCVGERGAVVRRLQHAGSFHFVIEQPDGTRALLPAWMTEPWAAQLTKPFHPARRKVGIRLRLRSQIAPSMPIAEYSSRWPRRANPP